MGKNKKNKTNKKEFKTKTPILSNGSHFRDTDKKMLGLLAITTLIGLIIYSINESYTFALTALPKVVLSAIVFYFFAGKFITRWVISVSLFAAINGIAISLYGNINAYFSFFIVAVLLISYRDWKVLVPITLITIALQVSTFFFYDKVVLFSTLFPVNNFPAFTSLQPFYSTSSFVYHLIFVLAHSLVCGLFSLKFSRILEIQEEFLNKVKKEKSKNKEQQKRIDKNIQLANEISLGNLETTISSANTDEMAQALLTMRESLREAKEKENTERYVIEGSAEIETILRANNDNLRVLSDKVVSKIVTYIEAAQGALFLVEQGNKHEEPYMLLTGAYAYDRSKFLDKKIKKGEGLAGECWIEGKAKDLKNLPNSYVDIKSALGKANPKHVYIVPLEYNEKILGVLEIASFEELNELRLEFINKIAENIAGSVSSVKVNEQTSHLLQESQDLTEQMRAQEEELRQNQEEMMATQEETNRQMSELQQKFETAQKEIEELKAK